MSLLLPHSLSSFTQQQLSIIWFCLLLPLSLTLITDQKNCPVPRVRNSWTSLTNDQQQLFITAVQLLKNQTSSPAFTVPRVSTYNIFPTIHNHSANTRCVHGSSLFLPFHRRFLWVLETSLRVAITNYNIELLAAKQTTGLLDACVTIPYWEWENDYGDPDQSPIFGNDTFGVPLESGCVENGKFAGWIGCGGTCLARQYTLSSGGIATGAGGMMDIVVNNPNYLDFENLMEGAPHSSVHIYVGGNMYNMVSPDDPIFFLHHANIDRFWTMWQDCHEYDKVPPSEATDSMYPSAGYGFRYAGCKYGIDSPIPYYWTTGQTATLFPGTATARMMLSLGSSTEQYGPDKIYLRYGPDTLVQTLLDPSTYTNGQPVCNFDGDWINYNPQSKKRLEQSPTSDNNNNKTNGTFYLFGTPENEKVFNNINEQWGRHPTKYKITYLALWECSNEVLGNLTLSVPFEWVEMNNFDNNNTFISICDKEGYHDGYEAYANLIDEQLFPTNTQVTYENVLEDWQLALIIVAVVIVVGILVGVVVHYFRKKSREVVSSGHMLTLGEDLF